MMLNVKDITIEYDGHPVVEHFSLEMQSGEVVSIVGESGSGKTTVIRAILGLLPEGGEVTEGEIIFEGKSLTDSDRRYIESLQGREMSMIFQDSGAMLNPIRRIGSQFIEYIQTHEKMSKKEAHARASKMLTAMRLPEAENVMRSYPFQLSGGMRQRVGIAMAMTFRPKLLLADEPTSALDVTTQAQIVRQMIDMYREYRTSIILVTHNLGVAAYMSDRILVMKDGRVIEEGNREAILKHPKNEYTRNLLEAIPSMEGEVYV